MKSKKYAGQIVAVFGPDGSGKSTIYKTLQQICERNHIKLDNQHWRPGFLPYKRKIWDVNRNESFTKPHSKSLRNSLISIIILIYIYFDFILGYYFILKPKLKKGINIYYERYFYDLLIDPQRYRLSLPRNFLQMLASIVIKPDIIILLEAPSNIIYARKQELTKEEIDRQRTKLDFVFLNKKNVYKIDVYTNDAKSCSFEIFALMKKSNG